MDSYNKTILGIITARGGSKGILRKNIKELAGKPLIAYTIEAAKGSGVFSRIVLSTDDDEIAEVGRKYGAEVPFMRPTELAKDTTPTLPVLIHAVEWLKGNENFYPDYTVILQPTAPLRQARHLNEALDLLIKSGADSVVSVCEVPGDFNPHWQLEIDRESRLRIFTPPLKIPQYYRGITASFLRILAVLFNALRSRAGFTGEDLKHIVRRRQDLPKTYFRNGAIYAFRTDLLFSSDPNFYGEDPLAYVMENKYNININSPEDFAIAEMRIKDLDE